MHTAYCLGACISISALLTGAVCRECWNILVLMFPIQSQDLRPRTDHSLGGSRCVSRDHGPEGSLCGTPVIYEARNLMLCLVAEGKCGKMKRTWQPIRRPGAAR